MLVSTVRTLATENNRLNRPSSLIGGSALRRDAPGERPQGLIDLRAWSITVWWVLLPLAALVPILAVRYPPLYDYYHWLFTGHLVAGILGGSGTSEPISSLYSLGWTPVPNMAAPGIIGVLNLLLPLELAGKLFLAACVLLFAFGFAYLVRSVQQRPTALELLGLPWAFGYFMYKGYDSYLFALGLALFALGKLHLVTTGSSRSIKVGDLALLSLLGALTYLSHLLGWAVFALGVVVYSAWLFRLGKRREALALPVSLVPSLFLLAWYLLASGNETVITIYDTLPTKLLSLIRPLMLFVRPEPVETIVPVFAANLLGLGLMAGLIWLNLERRPFTCLPHPLRVVGVALLSLAIVIPISQLGEAINPDERFTLPAVLVILATVRLKRLMSWTAALAGSLVLLVIGLHGVEYAQASASSEQLSRAVSAAIPPGVRVLSLSVFNTDLRDECNYDEAGLTIGVPTLKWFGLNRLLETGRLKANLMETSFVHARFDYRTESDLTVLGLDPSEVATPASLGSQYVAGYPYVQIFGCPADISAAGAALSPQYGPATQGDGFAVLKRR